MTKEYVLIGLGNFGRTVIDVFNSLMEERKMQLPLELKNKVVTYTLDFPLNTTPSFFEVSNRILDEIKDSQAKKNNVPFTFIFIGDLSEKMVSLYAMDFAYIPWVLNQRQTGFSKGTELGFFTFSDELDTTTSADKCDNETLALIRSFFTRLVDVDNKDSYLPPYKDARGFSFQQVSSPTGPFDRNYVLVTRGNQEAVNSQTSLVFSERIFYELFYLDEEYRQLEKNNEARRRDSKGACFSVFSMIQLTRLSEFQKYYLQYTLENYILNYLLAPKISGTDAEYYKERFFDMIDVPYKSADFPIDRAVELFIHNHSGKFRGLLSRLISNRNQDFTDYVKDCKGRIDSVVATLVPEYGNFVRTEMDALLKALDEGFTNLFRINHLTGNMNSYIDYLESLQSRFEGWAESLKKILAKETEDIDLEKEYEAIEKKIEKLQNSFVYKIPILVPIRKKIIENEIFKLPVEKYLEAVIKKELAKSFLSEWQNTSSDSRHPVCFCKNVVENVKKMQAALLEKKKHIESKIKYIEQANTFYYVISELSDKKYSELLERIKERNFGPGKKSELEETVQAIFKKWTGNDRDLVAITKDPDKFIAHIDVAAASYEKQFGNREEDVEQFGIFSRNAVSEMVKRTELNLKTSFQTESDWWAKERIMLNPSLGKDDLLEEEMQKVTLDKKVTIPEEFTLGSEIYFEDYLYLSADKFQKMVNLENYASIKTSLNNWKEGNASSVKVSEPTLAAAPIATTITAPKLAPTPALNPIPVVAEKVATVNATATSTRPPVERIQAVASAADTLNGIDDSQPLTLEQKRVLYIITTLCEGTKRLDLWEKFFGEKRQILPAADSEKLARRISLKEALDFLDDKKLNDYARSNGAAIAPNRERLIKSILRKFEN